MFFWKLIVPIPNYSVSLCTTIDSVLCLAYTNLIKFDCETRNYVYLNLAGVRSYIQPVLSNEVEVSCSSKQR